MQLDVDLAEARRHLALIDPTAARFIFAAYPDRKGGTGAPFQRLLPIEELGSAARHLQGRGYGIFVTMNAMHGDLRRVSEVAIVRAVWAEHDLAPTTTYPIDPTFVVQSSAAEHKRHLVFCLKVGELLTPSEAERINRAIAMRHGADRAAVDAARVLRLAGSWHLKQDPVRACIVEASGQRYFADELRQAFPAPPPAVQRPTDREVAPRGALRRFAEPLGQLAADDYRTWIEVGLALHHETGGSDEGLAVWRDWSAGSSKFRNGECDRLWAKHFGRRLAGIKLTGGRIFYLARHGAH